MMYLLPSPVGCIVVVHKHIFRSLILNLVENFDLICGNN